MIRFLDILHEAPLFGHRKPTRIVGSIVYCILLAGYAILAVGATWVFHPIRNLVLPLLCSCNAFLIVSTGIFQQYTVTGYYNLSVYGYYIALSPTVCYFCLRIVINAYGTAAILLIMVWEPHISISLSTLLRYSYSNVMLLLKLFPDGHAGYVHQYNSLDSEPDVLKSLYSPLQPSSSLEDVRYHDGGRLSDQQMALLQYQRENLHFLSEEILRLQECLGKYEKSSDGNTPQVDLAHLLAARDQELRTLSAEVLLIPTEASACSLLIAERDTDLQRIRSTNNQYVVENERLRAILGEWSGRAAKLERALEVERLSNLELQKKLTSSKKGTPSDFAGSS
ncbi:hypothetical protein Leryth_010458 [Lithospermum erythrorhizon]|nr:hypothetical protein Leryth_010458 [Lithospermum erythrorhizon]